MLCLPKLLTTSYGTNSFSYLAATSWNSLPDRASDRSRRKKSNFPGFLRTNSRKNRPISREFRRKFQGKLRQKAIGKTRPILWLFSRQISQEIDRFCADQTIANRGSRLLFQQQYA